MEQEHNNTASDALPQVDVTTAAAPADSDPRPASAAAANIRGYCRSPPLHASPHCCERATLTDVGVTIDEYGPLARDRTGPDLATDLRLRIDWYSIGPGVHTLVQGPCRAAASAGE